MCKDEDCRGTGWHLEALGEEAAAGLCVEGVGSSRVWPVAFPREQSKNSLSVGHRNPQLARELVRERF